MKGVSEAVFALAGLITLEVQLVSNNVRTLAFNDTEGKTYYSIYINSGLRFFSKMLDGVIDLSNTGNLHSLQMLEFRLVVLA